MSTVSHLENLNGQQRRAVTYGEPLPEKGYRSGPLLILAGAGTGKTDTLAHRIAHLVIHRVDPARMLLLTSTRRVATEMRRRAYDIVKKALSEPLGGLSQTISQRLSWAGTFHSIANRLLRHYARHLKLDPHFTVIDPSDAAELMDEVRAELGIATSGSGFADRQTCLRIYSRRVNTQSSLADTLARWFPDCARWESDLARLFRAYVERKQRAGLLDTDDLLFYWHAMMGETRLAQHAGRHFDHVIVDDGQDLNALQIQILLALKPDGSGLTVAGDETQAANPLSVPAQEGIPGLAARFQPPAEVVTLAQNYRSTQQVLDVANALLADAPRQQRRHLLSIRSQGTRPRYVTVDDAQAQAEYVSSEILRRRETGASLRGQAILLRSAAQGEVLAAELARRKIPYVRQGVSRFLESEHVRDVMAVLRWADNPRNSVAASRVIRLLPGTTADDARRAIEHLQAQGGSFERLKGLEPPQSAALDWGKLVALMSTLTEPQRQWQGQVHLVREWYRPHFERIYEHFHTRLSDLDHLELLSGQYPSRERFLTELTLEPPNATSDQAGQPVIDDDYVVISSVYAARGQQWDTVYVLGVAEGGFPALPFAGRPLDLERERRLLYVAMTRARSELVLVAPLRNDAVRLASNGQAQATGGGPSRFMTEKVLKCVDAVAHERAGFSDAMLQESGQAVLDVSARLREMW